MTENDQEAKAAIALARALEASQAGAGDEPMRDALVLARRIIEGVNKRYPIGAYSDDLRTIDKALTTPTRIEAAQPQEVVAWAARDWLRAITAQELARIPNEGRDKARRDRCRLLYPIPLYATPPIQAAESGLLDELDSLKHKLRMIVSHATGGSCQDIDLSVNDICVRISANRNVIYQAGKDAAHAKAGKQGEGDREG